jgi:hypothetical protein
MNHPIGQLVVVTGRAGGRGSRLHLGYGHDVQGPSYPRRRLLAFAAGVSLACLSGCGEGSRAGPSPTPPTTSSPSPDVALVDEVLRDERRLLALVDRTVLARPATADRLRLPRRIVAAHVRWLDGIRVAGRPVAPPPVDVAVPHGGRAAVAGVADACRVAASTRRHQCVRAGAGSLAQTLASISASHAVLAVELAGR